MVDAVPQLFAYNPTAFLIFPGILFWYLSGRLQDFCFSSSTKVGSTCVMSFVADVTTLEILTSLFSGSETFSFSLSKEEITFCSFLSVFYS